MRKRRSRLDIMIDILELCLDEPHMKTSILYRANLSHRQVEDYLRICLGIRLLKKQIEGSRVVYVTTEKGRKIVEAYDKLESLIEEEE